MGIRGSVKFAVMVMMHVVTKRIASIFFLCLVSDSRLIVTKSKANGKNGINDLALMYSVPFNI